jgi:hypothetical protein
VGGNYSNYPTPIKHLYQAKVQLNTQRTSSHEDPSPHEANSLKGASQILPVFSQMPQDGGTVAPILQRRKLRLRTVRQI